MEANGLVGPGDRPFKDNARDGTRLRRAGLKDPFYKHCNTTNHQGIGLQQNLKQQHLRPSA